MSAMDTSDNAGAADAAAASAASPAAPAPAPTEAASSSTAAAAASSSAAAAAASPSATAGGESDDDDIVVNEKDLTEDAITGGEGAPPPGPKKRRGRPAAAAADATPRVIGADALERLNELLRRTEQFAKFVPSDSAKKGGKGKSSGGRHHERAEEEAEDKELVADELQQAEVKNNWPDHLDQQPTSVVKDKGLPMRDYQLEALNWLIKLHDQNLNGILADEMGLGKTLESLSLLAYLKQYRNYDGPHLIIVPKSTSSNWLREVNRWTNNLSVFRFHGNQEERDALKPQVKLNDITITTYEMVILEKSFFAKQKWKYIYIDEAHRIKNENSLLSRVVRTFSSEHRLLITGTPLQNNLHELWALLNFLVPSLFGSSEDFAEWFNVEDPTQRGEIVARLHRLLRPFLLRRLKSEVEKALLPKIETKLFVGMSAMQRAWYKKILERDIEVLNATNTSKVRLLNIVMQLRKVCNHPYLFTGAEPGPPYLEGEHIVENSSKMVLLDKLLKKLKAAGNRVLIFSQMTRILDILEDFSRYRGYEYCRIDGSSKQDERDEGMELFNAPNSTKFIFLLSTRAGGLGINLQTADTVILFDSDWNPQMDLQAMDRAHRIGQKKQVTVFRFVVEHSIEQKMVERATKKLFLDALVVQKGRLHDSEKVVNAAELQEMVRFGANRIFSGADTEVTDADIDLILSRGSELTKAETEKLKQSTGNDLLNFSLSDKTDTNFQQFEGKDYKGYRAQQGFEFIEPAARSRKSNYDINAYYKEALRVTDKKSAKNTREFKPTQRFDYQFFQIERLDALERKDFESKQKLYNLKLAQRVKAKEEKRLKEEQEKEARRKARIANRKQRKLEERAAAEESGAAQAPSAEGAKSDDEGDDSDDDAAAAASSSAAAAPAAAAAAASPVKDEGVVKMELDGEDVKAEPAAAASASSADTAVKMEDAAAADADGRRKSNRSRLSTAKDSPAPSPAPSAKAEDEGEEEGGEGGDDLEALMAEAGCLSAEEQAELKALQEEGFGTWSRRHITSLTKAMEKYGRDDLSNIKVSVEEKTPEEVEQYYFVFWKKYKMIKDWDRILKQIERGEQRLQKQKALQVVIDNKCKRFKNNYEKMTIPYPTTSQKSFTEEEDKFLIVSLHRLGYGNWEDLKTAIRSSWMFRFDWFFKTRTCGELSKRVEYLLKILEKEQAEWDEEKKRLEKKRKEKLLKDQAKIVAAAGGPSPIKKSSKSDKGDKDSSKDKNKDSGDKSSTKKKDKKSDKDDADAPKKKKSHKDKDKEGSSKSDKGDKSDKPHKSHKDKDKDKDKDKEHHKSHKKDKSDKDASSSEKKKEKDKKDKKDSSSSSSKKEGKSDKSGDHSKESKKRKDHDGSSSAAAASSSSSSKSDDKSAKKAKVDKAKGDDKHAKDKTEKKEKAPTSAASAPSATSSTAASAPAKMSDD